MISVIVRSHPIVITIHQLKPRQRLTDAPPAPKVMSGKRFRVQPPRVQPEILNIALAVGHWAAATGTAVLMIAGCTLWARLVLGCVIWPTLLAAAFVASSF